MPRSPTLSVEMGLWPAETGPGMGCRESATAREPCTQVQTSAPAGWTPPWTSQLLGTSGPGLWYEAVTSGKACSGHTGGAR